MFNDFNKIFTEQVRAYIYRVLIAIGVLLSGFGLISGDQLALIMGLVVAILNIMPSANTSTKVDKNGKA
jgi:hypothetical protein